MSEHDFVVHGRAQVATGFLDGASLGVMPSSVRYWPRGAGSYDCIPRFPPTPKRDRTEAKKRRKQVVERAQC